MAHAVESLAYANEVPWHGLGVNVDDTISPSELLKVAGLDWSVQKRSTFFQTNAGEFVPTGKWALIRSTDDAVLSPSMAEGWEPCQNSTALEFFTEFCRAGEMKMETAGSLKGGKFVFALAKIQESFQLDRRDRVDAHLLFSNPHVCGNSINVQFTPIRVVCANTLAMALEGATSGRFRQFHTAKFDPEEAKTALGLSKNIFADFKEKAKFLSSKRYTQEDLTSYFQQVFPANDDAKGSSRRALLCMSNLESQPGAEMSEGSWWQAFNTVTYVADHVLGRSADSRMANSWFGWTRQRKQEALGLALEMAEAA